MPSTFSAEFSDESGVERLAGRITFTGDGDQPAALNADATAFVGVTRPLIENATAPALLAALVTLGLVIDDT